jgi:hypothetical protein
VGVVLASAEAVAGESAKHSRDPTMRFLPLAMLAVAAGMGAMVPLAAAHPDGAGAKLVAFRAEAKVTLDAAGKPLSIEPSQDLPASIREFIRQRVATWHFSPPEQNGVTGPAVTYLRLGACAIPQADGNYQLAVDFKDNGPLYANGPMMRPPAYPKEALIRGVEAKAYVTYVVGVDGLATVEGIEYEDRSNHRRDGIDSALRDWVRGMRYEPEQLAGRAVRTRLRVPVDFSLVGPEESARDLLREEIHQRAVKSEECRLAAGDAAPAEGLRPVALNSPVRLDPAG